MRFCKRKRKEATHQQCCNGCLASFVITPGVCGFSIGSSSGGTAVPSTLRVRAVMASMDGMFLKPLTLFTGLSITMVSCASLSTFSAVSGSPGPAVVIASPLTEPLVEIRREVERVMGALMATESASEVVVETEVWSTFVEDRQRREVGCKIGLIESYLHSKKKYTVCRSSSRMRIMPCAQS